MSQLVDSAPASFTTLGVSSKLIGPLKQQGASTPFPIQTATLPDTLEGRDVLGRGRTGSGKTLAFSIPLVSRLAGLTPSGSEIARRSSPGAPRGLVLAPTRELASQIVATIQPLADAAMLRVTTIVGGVSKAPQVRQLRRGVDIVVATPGRLEDLKSDGELRLDDVAVTVLDEADHMADLGFLPGVTRILAATPAGGQRMLFSATLDSGIDKLVKRFLRRPLTHSVDSESSPVSEMSHYALLVANATEKTQVIRALAAGQGRRLLFTRTKHQARRLARELTAAGIPAVELHGNLSQNARERGLKAFADGQVRVMVATDIAARGIHVDDIELVVHVDPPAEHKSYLHRSGRTARAGHSGEVITLVLPEQRRDFQSLARAAHISATPKPVHPDDPVLARLRGAAADPVAPELAPAAASRRVPQATTTAKPAKSRQAAPRRGENPRGEQARPGRSQSGKAQSKRSVADFSRQANRRGGSQRAA
ncbi:DEAD/DEAH box helicase [Brooklawnia sp.]|uniref:DEAD/DEAH box helicase n=1 Tax=Brooklawnia sp. TaxID=2699740 RepID=UPI00311E2F14